MTTPLRITQVSLHRFKAAYALENVPLRPFNVIIGRNGTGKSTLLEALQWIDTAVRHTPPSLPMDPRAVAKRQGRMGSEYILRQFFADPDGKPARAVREHPIARRLAHILPRAP